MIAEGTAASQEEEGKSNKGETAEQRKGEGAREHQQEKSTYLLHQGGEKSNGGREMGGEEGLQERRYRITEENNPKSCPSTAWQALCNRLQGQCIKTAASDCRYIVQRQETMMQICLISGERIPCMQPEHGQRHGPGK